MMEWLFYVSGFCCVLFLIRKEIKVSHFPSFLIMWMVTGSGNPLIGDKELFILHSPYHCCWCPVEVKSQAISCYGIELVLLGLYSISGKTSYHQILWSLEVCEIECYNDHIALKFDWHLSSAAAEVPVKFQSDWKNLDPNLVASILYEILR